MVEEREVKRRRKSFKTSDRAKLVQDQIDQPESLYHWASGEDEEKSGTKKGKGKEGERRAESLLRQEGLQKRSNGPSLSALCEY